MFKNLKVSYLMGGGMLPPQMFQIVRSTVKYHFKLFLFNKFVPAARDLNLKDLSFPVKKNTPFYGCTQLLLNAHGIFV